MANKPKIEYIVPMLDKSLRILDYIYRKPGFRGIAEISQSLDIAKGTVFRILYTLQYYNFVRKNELDQYSLGPSFISYATQLKNEWDILSQIHPHLEEAAKSLGESINFGVLLENNVVFLDSVDGEEFYIVKNLVPFSPLYCSSSGKIFLSQMSKEDLDAYFENVEFKEKTVSTITDPQKLHEEIEEVKVKGLAYDREEYTYGLSCMAKGVYGKDKLLATISLSGPTSRIKHKGVEKMQEGLIELARTLENIPGIQELLTY